MSLIIIGAGIGGLTTAIALKQRGIVAQVHEKAAAIRPVGAGIVVPPNAMAVLERLGLADAVRAAGVALKGMDVRTHKGKLIQGMNVQDLLPETKYPAIAIRRAALHEVLLGALPPQQVHVGHACTGIDRLGNRVRVRFQDGTTVEAQAVIAADGLHSVVRRQLLPSTRPRYAGQTSFRGIAHYRLPEALWHHAWELWGGPLRFGMGTVGPDTLYWYSTVVGPAGTKLVGQEAKVRLQDQYRGFHPYVAQALEHTPPDAIVQTDLFDHPPGPPWTDGSIALLGDAAHATTPNLGQGGAQAIEDAWTLARCMAEQPDAAAAFRTYEQRRRAKADEVIALSYRFGKLSEWTNPLACAARNWILAHTPHAALRKQYGRIMAIDD